MLLMVPIYQFYAMMKVHPIITIARDYSIIRQAGVDFRGSFMDVYICWPGKVHDARVCANASVYLKRMSGTLLPDWKKNICGVDVCILL